MNKETVERFKPFILTRLRVEKVDFNNKEESVKSLKRCVLGGRLVTAYLILIKTGDGLTDNNDWRSTWTKLTDFT